MDTHTRTTLGLATVLGLTAGAAFFALIVMAAQAGAHDAMPTAAKPQGWKYPFSCCSDYDCRRVPADWIVEGREGYRIVPTGEIVPMTDTRVKESPDGEFHWCSVAGANDGRTICLFAPPRSY